MITIQMHGRLTREPELRELPDGTKLAALRVAANDCRGRVVYINCVEFGNSGEATVRTLRKGSEVVFQGELRFREVSGENGRREYYSAVGHTEFVGGRPGSGQAPPPSDGESTESDDSPF